MKKIASIVVFILLCGCTPKPVRPSTLNIELKKAYEECEREYAVCLNGGSPEENPIGTEYHGEEPQELGRPFGWESSCNSKLKDCYNKRAQENPKP